MSKIDDIVAKQIGSLMLTNMKQQATIEQLAAQVQQQAAEIERLKAASPELPLTEARPNGASAPH